MVRLFRRLRIILRAPSAPLTQGLRMARGGRVCHLWPDVWASCQHLYESTVRSTRPPLPGKCFVAIPPQPWPGLMDGVPVGAEQTTSVGMCFGEPERAGVYDGWALSEATEGVRSRQGCKSSTPVGGSPPFHVRSLGTSGGSLRRGS